MNGSLEVLTDPEPDMLDEKVFILELYAVTASYQCVV